MTTDLSVVSNLLGIWPSYNTSERRKLFFSLGRHAAEELFLNLSTNDQLELIEDLSQVEMRSWLRFLPPDDTADLLQKIPKNRHEELLALLDERTRHDVIALLAYAEDDAGGLMNPEYIRLRPDMTVSEAIGYLRAQARTRVKIYYAYVLDTQQILKGVISLRELLLQPADKLIQDIMRTRFLYVREDTPSEDVARLFSKNSRLLSIPVLDAQGQMKGIVTHDDIASVVEEQATEDIHRFGAVEALDGPYFQVGLFDLVKKRAGWLVLLFLGEMFTATAMGHYEQEIARAVVLALFIPLIISSGGNSGSQASTLIVRSLALQEIQLRDWLRVLRREIASGIALGSILGCIGIVRIILWQQWAPLYGEHYILVALTVGASLLGVVLWGTLAGSMLPFVLSKLKFDPARASAPFVATLVDVTGLIIYFTAARLILGNLVL